MEREYVGIDFHRRRSVVVRVSAAGERLSVVRVDNDPVALAAAVTEAGPCPEVVIEATYGWYWVVDLLQALGARVHLANPKALNWGDRRVKNDVVDATDLADMLRLGRLPEAWIAPPAIRELRELVRYRAKLVQLRSGLKATVFGYGLHAERDDLVYLFRRPRLLALSLLATFRHHARRRPGDGGVSRRPPRGAGRPRRHRALADPTTPAEGPHLRGRA